MNEKKSVGPIHPREALLVGPVLLFAASRLFLTPTDPDYWWHLRTGQWILENGRVPATDFYSHTAFGRLWVTHEWLTEVLMAAIQGSTGYVGNVLLWAAMSLAVGGLVYATCRLRGIGPMGGTFLSLLALGLTFGTSNVRPSGVTTLLLALSAYLLTCYRLGAYRLIWALPPLLLLWANLHGGYAIGLVLLATTFAGELLDRWAGRPAAPLGPLAVAGLLSGVAVLINPNGLEAILYPLSYTRGNASLQLVLEWQSPNFKEPYFWILAATLIGAGALGMAQAPLRWSDTLWFALFSFLALQSIRHVALFAVVVTPLIAARLAAVWPRLQQPVRHSGLVPLAALWASVLLGTYAMFAGAARQGWPLQVSRQPSTAGFPAASAQFLREHPEVQGNLFNHYAWGGYLIYTLWPERRVFVDGRADPYGDQLLRDYAQIDAAAPTWRSLLGKYGVRVVVIPRETPLDGVLSRDDEWQEAFSARDERVYVRRTGS